MTVRIDRMTANLGGSPSVGTGALRLDANAGNTLPVKAADAAEAVVGG